MNKHKLFLDFEKTTGPIKPMNGVNSGPQTQSFTQDASRYFKEAGIPFSRLHDTEYRYGHGEFVDINCIFKNFNRDADDPAAYNFTFTDRYLQAICDVGTEIIYRLGCSIEHQASKRYIFPPRDYLKWAQICEHIIRHYNEGWNNGFHLNIEYWEIWNEPDGSLWQAEKSEYYRFYKTAVTYLKKCFPGLKFGGPALCAGSNAFAEEMMAYLTEGERTPLDFYSWHTYSHTPEGIKRQAELAKDLLVRYGYTDTLSIIDEWNYVLRWDNVWPSVEVIQSLKGAAFNAAVMSVLQDTETDIAAYYDSQLCFDGKWDGLFAPGHRAYVGDDPDFCGAMLEVEPKKGYYPFKAFHKLQELGTQVSAVTYAPHVYVTAAVNGKKAAVMLTNFCDEAEEAVLLEPVVRNAANYHSEFYLLDEYHDLTLVSESDVIPGSLELAANSVLLWVMETEEQ